MSALHSQPAARVQVESVRASASRNRSRPLPHSCGAAEQKRQRAVMSATADKQGDDRACERPRHVGLRIPSVTLRTEEVLGGCTTCHCYPPFAQPVERAKGEAHAHAKKCQP